MMSSCLEGSLISCYRTIDDVKRSPIAIWIGKGVHTSRLTVRLLFLKEGYFKIQCVIVILATT